MPFQAPLTEGEFIFLAKVFYLSIMRQNEKTYLEGGFLSGETRYTPDDILKKIKRSSGSHL
jgi:hypothetical protein